MKKFEIENHKPSLLPEGKKWKLAWSDEFDGDTLDESKWDFRLNFWGRRFEAYTDKGVILKNGCVELHRTEKDGYYVSPQLQTGSNSFDVPKDVFGNPWGQDEIWRLGELKPAKFEHRYGYYEVRCKFQKEPDVMWSAFWLQSPSIGTTYNPAWSGVENDIMEHFYPDTASSGNIYGGYGKQYTSEGRANYPLKKTDDGFHRFGMLWTKDEYVFYCDGEEVSRSNKGVSQVPQFILLTTEVRGHRNKTPLKIGEYSTEYRGIRVGTIKKRGAEFTDDAFIVDYVCVFDEVEE